MKILRKLFGMSDPDPHSSSGVVRILDSCLEYESGVGVIKRIAWDDVNLVEIVTTDEGPFAEDVFFVVSGSTEGSELIVPNGAEGSSELLGRVQKMPGCRNEQIIKAMSCADNKRFLLWSSNEG